MQTIAAERSPYSCARRKHRRPPPARRMQDLGTNLSKNNCRKSRKACVIRILPQESGAKGGLLRKPRASRSLPKELDSHAQAAIGKLFDAYHLADFWRKGGSHHQLHSLVIVFERGNEVESAA